jgi:hypothetical protein
VLGANVAHNAVHVGRFLNGVRELIAPGGVLMLIASCREHYLAMTSMQFLMSARPGAEQPRRTDVRAGTDRVFLTREGEAGAPGPPPSWWRAQHGRGTQAIPTRATGPR